VNAAISGGEQEIVVGEHQGGEMWDVHAAQFARDRELGGVFDGASPDDFNLMTFCD
jgi:hypothetical protein